MKSKAYRAINVNDVDIAALLEGHDRIAVVYVGLDIGKERIMCVVRWQVGDFERPWLVKNPADLVRLASLLGELGRSREGKLIVAMEPTGTYGDALRQALAVHEARKELQMHWVSPKKSSDYAEIFDGVPSQHDGKDAAVVAELASQGHSRAWPLAAPSDSEREISFRVDAMDRQRRQMKLWTGSLEALMSRHWPEATRIVKLISATLLRCLKKYGGPRGLADAADGLAQVKKWGRNYLRAEKAEALVKSASSTQGVRMDRWDEEEMRRFAREIRRCQKEIRESRRRLCELAKDHAAIQSMGEVIGVPTACVLWSELGNPKEYHCGAAYRKAMGLNLAERSSGKWQGQLKISKRGSSRSRRWLYLAAMRWVKQEPVRGWYDRQLKSRRGKARPALVGVMRKLAMALYQVAGRGKLFDADQLYRSVTTRTA